MTRYAIGIGCRRGCTADAIVQLVRRVWAEAVGDLSLHPRSEERSDAAVHEALGTDAALHRSPRFACDDGTLVEGNIERRGPAQPRLVGLFSIDLKCHEAGLRNAAAALSLPLGFLPETILQAQLARVLTVSPRVAEAVGVSSVAEAAALAGAGQGARLLGPRQARDGITCAVAIAAETQP